MSEPPTVDEQNAWDAALEQRYAAEDLAVSVLWALSGRQFGLCPARVRPCRGVWHRFNGEPAMIGYLLAWDRGRWVRSSCGCRDRCTVGGPRAVHILGPVAEIRAVTIGGVVLDESEYVLDGDVLYRRGNPWPGQDLGRPLGEHDTWSVDYLRGFPPPAGTANMVGTLAKEFLAACSEDTKCRLPRTVTVANRNGITYRAYDPAVIYASGKTGIPEIDLWLSAVNPNALAAAPSVI